MAALEEQPDHQSQYSEDPSDCNGFHRRYLVDQLDAASSCPVGTAPDYTSEGSVASTASTFTQFRRNYSLRFWDPLVCCKLRKRTQRLTYGIDGLVNPSTGQERFSLLLKPVQSSSLKAPGHWINKVSLQTTQLSAEVMSPKISIGFLRLQLMVRLTPSGVADLAWRFTTRWTRDHKPSLMKPRVYLDTIGVNAVPNLEIRPHIKSDIFSPEICGRVGASADVEQGHAHIRVPRLHLRYELGGQRRGRNHRENDAAKQGVSEETNQWIDDMVQGLVPHSTQGQANAAETSGHTAPKKRHRRFGLPL